MYYFSENLNLNIKRNNLERVDNIQFFGRYVLTRNIKSSLAKQLYSLQKQMCKIILLYISELEIHNFNVFLILFYCNFVVLVDDNKQYCFNLCLKHCFVGNLQEFNSQL